jgi:hypothetical protein
MAGIVLMGIKVHSKSGDTSVPPLWTLEFLQFCLGYLNFFCFKSELMKKIVILFKLINFYQTIKWVKL